jgi:orotidine-5'-phosphate decarboxylase
MLKDISPRDRLIVGLDMADLAAAERMVATLGESVTFYKVGMELVYGGGLALVPRLVEAGKKVFVDLKLHDIPNTVERATAQIAKLGATFLTVHAYPQTMRAAKKGTAESSLQLLAVTVLTSCDDEDLTEAGYAYGVEALVSRRGVQAQAEGVAGLVASPAEAAQLRAAFGPQMILVTPGVRPSGAATGDQKRVATPARAIGDGADYLVVARPVIANADPRRAAEAIAAEIADAPR